MHPVTILATLNTLSAIATVYLLLMLYKRDKNLNSSSRLVLRTLINMSWCQLMYHMSMAIKQWIEGANPNLFKIHSGSCFWFRLPFFLFGMSDFMWSLILAAILFVLVQGYSLRLIERTFLIQHFVVLGIALILSLLALLTGNIGETPHNAHYVEACASSANAVMYFYGLCMITFVIHVLALCAAICQWKHVYMKTTVGKMVAFVLAFATIWAFPCATRLMEVWTKQSVLSFPRSVITGLSGSANFILALLLLAHKASDGWWCCCISCPPCCPCCNKGKIHDYGRSTHNMGFLPAESWRGKLIDEEKGVKESGGEGSTNQDSHIVSGRTSINGGPTSSSTSGWRFMNVRRSRSSKTEVTRNIDDIDEDGDDL